MSREDALPTLPPALRRSRARVVLKLVLSWLAVPLVVAAMAGVYWASHRLLADVGLEMLRVLLALVVTAAVIRLVLTRF